ncbi:DUF2946 domain-containing protein [Chakrabartia godavariana]|nr:DUF2946 domain-containing protein [Chakrabartia godavariana]
MTSLRAFIRDNRKLATLLVGLALFMKALVPAGYMLGTEGRVLTVEICSDASGGHLTKQIVIPTDGKSHEGQTDHAKADGTCPFASLAMGTVGGADPALLLVALAFILLLAFAPPVLPMRERPDYLRPPLRGPPAFA